METGLFRLFRQHWKDNGLDSADPTPVFEAIVSAYGEPWRHYHTLQHLGECMDELLLASQQPALATSVQLPIVALALWFHDIVYDPRANDNEEASAAIAVAILTQANADRELLDQVASLILATKTHVANDPHDLNAMLLLDIDLSILGKSPDRFAEYEKQIRAEYQWVPLEVYTEKRGQILQGFLDRPSLFLTSHFRSRFDQQARRNLEATLQHLS